MHRISIRTAGLDDLETLSDIFRTASLSNEGDRDLLLAHPEHLELGREALVEERVRVAEVDGMAVGFATTRRAGDAAELEDLFVRPEWMRHGMATALIEDVIERERLAGVARLEVTANPHARAFYDRVGFRGDERVETPLGAGTRLHLHVPPRG